MPGKDYKDIRKKYGMFTYPMAVLRVGDKLFSDNRYKLVLSEVQVELSCGMEASAVTYSIYNVYDLDKRAYKYAQFKDFVQLGSPVTVSMGYSGVVEEMFVGFIAQTRFVYGDGDIHHVEVTAMDAKGLMMSGSYARQMTADNYGDAVSEIFSRPLYQKMSAEGIYKSVRVDATPDKNSTENNKETSYSVEMVSESDYEFIVKAAKRFHYEFYVDTGIIYFRKAKQAPEDCLMEIGMDKGVTSYDITYDITGLVKSVEVRGMDTARAAMVSAVRKVSNKISTGNKAKALIGQTQRTVIDAAAVSKDQAQCRADSLMEDISYRFGTLECDCVGIPELKPGHFVKITGLECPGDNQFYITHVRHMMSDENGYSTHITAMAASLMS
ncbi:MAG: hypothetical protein K2N73_11025 [Lachnospiraceae bacterium]|nr:hypothetical protein [Lachnospiraceae bacterium]